MWYRSPNHAGGLQSSSRWDKRAVIVPRLEPEESVAYHGHLHPWVLSGGVAFGGIWVVAALLIVARNDLSHAVTANPRLTG